MTRRGLPRLRDDAIRVGAYGFFGMGNIGNEGTLDAFLEQVRATHPDASFICFGADGHAVRHEHGIPAVELMTYRAPAHASGPSVLAGKALGRLWDIPRTLWLVGKVDVLIVPGTGVLESRLTSSPWGLPYWLFLAVAACRIRARRVALVSVGAEPTTNAVMRFFMSRIIRLVDYVSYRDAASADAAKSMGSTGSSGAVYPDLAFALAAPDGVTIRPGHVAIGVMEFAGGAGDPVQGPSVVERYVASMVELLHRLCGRGRTVTLVIGDRADLELARRILQRLRARSPGVADRVSVASQAHDLNSIMREMARAEVVVASRFHNVVAALAVGKPVVSLGYARKNRDLLQAFGLPDWSQNMDDFDVDRAAAEVEEAAARRIELEPVIQARLESYRTRLADQMEELSRRILESRSNHSDPLADRR
jgi:polysaccharide pyruvyl transferase WcaK-like protein